jgi:hypothetical protein
MLTFLRRLITRRFEPLTKREIAVLRVVCLFEPASYFDIAKKSGMRFADIRGAKVVTRSLERWGYVYGKPTIGLYQYGITPKGRRYLLSIKGR